MNYLTFIFILSAAIGVEMNSPSDSSPLTSSEGLRILALGGNGFIGSTVISALLLSNPLHRITIASRGNWYFDSERLIKPFVRTAECDREGDIEFCTSLMKAVENEIFDVVLDFSGYKPESVEQTLDLLKKKCKLYIYISSDSVYEVVQPFTPPALESYSLRPTDEEERDRLNDLDNYADEKLEGEELIIQSRKEGGPPYVIFRLPDVVGPRDTTDRWWTYQLWIQLYDFIQMPLQIPKTVLNLTTSYVYVKDVAQAILLAISKGSSVHDQIYNLGAENDKTLREFLQGMADEMKVEVTFNENGNFNLFPSVTRGNVDITKVKTKLGFVPTPWSTVYKETVEFYKEAFHTFPSERDDASHSLTRYVLPRERKGPFLKHIENLTHGQKEEL